MAIRENIQNIMERMRRACEHVNKVSEDVKLVAVTKTIDKSRILEALDCGIVTIGENKVQEIVDKYPYLETKVDLHMIGHLQTNKVKYIVNKVSMIESVDSIKLVEEINRRFGNLGRNIDILVEINIGREESKHGIDPEEVDEFLKASEEFNFVNIRGLMAVAPAFDDLEKVRPYFREMKKIFDKLSTINVKNVHMDYLSMGMTNDFEVAIEEGANIVRIGSGIFGSRNY